jgi:hypothetical protein
MTFCRNVAALALAFLLISVLSADALACACCAEPGTYYLRTAKADSYHLDLIRDISFAPKASLYMTEAGFDNIKGIEAVKKEDEATAVAISDSFDLTAGFHGRAWRFDITTPKGAKGSLTLPMPIQMVSYGADIHDNEDEGLGPLLYKEFRFKGNVAAGTGFARSGVVRGTTYFLVFQGRGRGCDEVSNFRNWRLEIVGPRANYAFYGTLSSAEKREAD